MTDPAPALGDVPDRGGDAFEAGYGFPLDRFQREAIDALIDGRSVLVAAPTGAGKTVVGEFACWAAVTEGSKCFYTTPIKALSNQKYHDLVRRHGADQVGLLTGDRSINGEARVVVMTTEVLRNMIYEGSRTLLGLRYVVLDEVHYLGDRARGGVWEEVIIQLPASTQIAALSATVSNAEEFGEWMAEVRDGCHVVIEEERPVPLRHHYWVNDTIHDTFRTGRKKGASKQQREQARQALGGVPSPDVLMLERNSQRGRRVNRRGRHVRAGPRLRWPSRPDVVEELAARRWLPAILFVFSRQGCEDGVAQLLRAGITLTGKSARDEIREIADTILADIPQTDLDVLGHAEFLDGLLHGVAAHHAGMVPAFKETVEACFQRGLLQVVVATETLALGINMPAKTVVIERLEKWDGERHTLITPGQYTQLTGRAGRRGMDRVGHAIVLYQRNIDFPTVAGLVGTRTFPLDSSFSPSYNMAVNLLRQHSRQQAETLLGASFAQFQTDRQLTGRGKRLVELDEGTKGYARNLRCDRGDWQEYDAIRRELSTREKATARARHDTHDARLQTVLAAVQPGDVIALPWAPNRGLAAVVGVQLASRGAIVLQLVLEDHDLTKVGDRDLDAAPQVVDHVDLPDRGNPRQSDYREAVASKLRRLDRPPPEAMALPEVAYESDPEVEALRTRLREHPVHACPDRDEHQRWQHRYDEVSREAERLRANINREAGSLVRQFDRILQVLGELGYVEGDQPTGVGLTLAGIYSEVDLLVAECLRRGVLEGLGAGELAGVAAHFVYEPRGGELTEDPLLPTMPLIRAVERIEEIAAELRAREAAVGLTPTRELDGGFVAPAYRWARGLDLDTALGGMDLTGGDFVRNVKQVADLVGQLRDVGDRALRTEANAALEGLRRGIVEI